MGIRLEWEIAAEDERVRSIGEDPDAARKRRNALVRLLLTITLLVGIAAGIVAFIFWRFDQVNSQLERQLRDTVTAEVTALRLGDWNAFSDFQRSATDDWLREQRTTFDTYQAILRADDSARLTGKIVEIEIDDPRARVHIEEIIDGIAYTRIWSYWFYENGETEENVDGWRHVPLDYTFWGEPGTYSGDNVQINYRSVDAEVANAMGIRLDDWISISCRILDCGDLPRVQVEIVSDDTREPRWTDTWRVVVPSPYLNRARSDMPFSLELQQQIGSLIAQRLVGDAAYPSDAHYIRNAAQSWLVGQYLLVETDAHLLESLIRNYGEDSLRQLLTSLSPDANIGVLSQIIGTPLDQADLDWRDFFTWRLNIETDLILRQDVDAVLALYDTSDPGVLQAAQARLSQPAPPRVMVLDTQPHTPGPDGSPQRSVTVTVTGSAQQQIWLFRLKGNNWLRAS